MASEETGNNPVRLKVPVRQEDLAGLKIGTVVYLDGLIYTAREGVYKKILEDGESLPDDLISSSNANFHCSPAAAIEDDGTYNVGGVTATASFRFSKWMAEWLSLSGAKIIIGKGGMSEKDYREMFVPAGAIYLTTVGYGTVPYWGVGLRTLKRSTGPKNWVTPRQCGFLRWKISVPFWSRVTSRAIVYSNNRES